MKGFIKMIDIDYNIQEILDNASKDIKTKETSKKQIQVPETTNEKLEVLIEFVRNLITEDTQKIKFNRLFPKPKK